MNRLTTIVVELPNHWVERGAERLWARRTGGDLYELAAVPFFAYGLSFGDVVRADPVVREIVRPSGHTTLRVVFRRDDEPRARRMAVLSELAPLKVSFESWGDAFFALDVAPDGDLDAVVERLERLEKRGVLGFETCEARRSGSFDEDHSSLRAG